MIGTEQPRIRADIVRARAPGARTRADPTGRVAPSVGRPRRTGASTPTRAVGTAADRQRHHASAGQPLGGGSCITTMAAETGGPRRATTTVAIATRDAGVTQPGPGPHVPRARGRGTSARDRPSRRRPRPGRRPCDPERSARRIEPWRHQIARGSASPQPSRLSKVQWIAGAASHILRLSSRRKLLNDHVGWGRDKHGGAVRRDRQSIDTLEGSLRPHSPGA